MLLLSVSWGKMVYPEHLHGFYVVQLKAAFILTLCVFGSSVSMNSCAVSTKSDRAGVC